MMRGIVEKDADGRMVVPRMQRFGPEKSIYAFTTENIAGYFPRLQFNEADALVVAGSGDQTINACMLGAKSVTCYDINPRALCFTELKIAGLRQLDRTSFLAFFEQGERAMEPQVYEALRPSLSDDARTLFDTLYVQYGFDGRQLRSSPVFNNKYDDPAVKRRSNPYLADDAAFERARAGIATAKISLLETCATRLAANVERNDCDGRFAIIHLSNIADYARELFPGRDCLGQFRKRIVEPLRSHVRPGGSIVAAYLYAIDAPERRSPIDDSARRDAAFGVHEEFAFESVIPGARDAIIILRA